MPTTYVPGCRWKLTEESTEPEYSARTSISGSTGQGGHLDITTVSTFRETYIQVWARPITADSTIPDSPVNPGNLPLIDASTGGYLWRCIDRGTNQEYGNASAKMYYETWQRKGTWEDI